MLRSCSIVAAIVIASAAFWPDPAASQNHPELAPTRPVVVTYELSGASQMNGATKVQISYSAQPDRVRLDFFRVPSSPDPFGTLIFDKPHNRVITLLPARKAYLQRDATGLVSPGQLLTRDMRFTRQGTEQFAGTTCTDWAISNNSQTGTVCVTNDGVALKATRGSPNPGEMRAIAIEYKVPPDSAFAVPSDYTRMKTKPSGS